MPSLTSQLIVSLIDRVSGPAKPAAAALKGVAAAAKSVSGTGTAKGVDNLAASLERVNKAAGKLGAGGRPAWEKQFTSLQLNARELKQVAKDYEEFQRRMASTFGKGAFRPSNYLPALAEWRTRMVANIRAVRDATTQAAADQEKAQSRMFRGWRGGARMAAGALGVGSAAYAANRVGRGTLAATAENARESARDYLAGLNTAETARLSGAGLGLSGRFPSVDQRTMHESLREAATSMRSVDKALEIGDVMAKGLVVMQSLKGKDQALEEGRKFFKALDTMGKNMDPNEVRDLYNGYVKAMGVEGADLNMGDLLQVARLSKSAGPGLSNRFLMSTAPGLMGDMGASRFGTALGSEVAQVIGGRATKVSKAEQQKYGLRDKKGAFLDSTKIMTDPDKYAWENLMPALQKKGINPDDIPAVTKATNALFSNQVVSDLFTKLITQRAQYQGKAAQYDKAPGIEAASALPGKDPFVSLQGAMSQLRNSASILAEGPLATAVPLLNSFTDAIARLNSVMANNPEITSKIGTAAAVGGGALGLWGTGLMVRKGVRWAFDKGPKISSAAAEVLPGAAGSATAAGSSSGWFANLRAAAPGMLRAAPFALGTALNPNVTINTRPDGKAPMSPSEWWRHRFGNPGQQGVRTRAGSTLRAGPSQIETGTGTIGASDSGSDVWNAGTKAVDHLNQSSEAAGAGAKNGSAFRQAMIGELKSLETEVQAYMQRITGMLNISASPSITPKFGPVPSVGGQKGASLEGARARQQAAQADYGFNTVG